MSKPSRHRKPSEIYSRKKPATQMHKHKLSKNEGSQAVALREALVKLQELELQSTENRVKVGHVQNRVAEFMYTFESTFTGKNKVTPEDYQMFQDGKQKKISKDRSNWINKNTTTLQTSLTHSFSFFFSYKLFLSNISI